jgi:Mg-chelatase subunit ChlD
VPTASTDIYDALNNGITDISANARPTAKKAIVLFTDGVPTATLPNNSNATILALDSACVTNKISVYCIGLAQNALIISQEDALLQPLAQNGYTGGQYIKTVNATQLDSAFQSIARSLVLLQGQ